MTLGDVFSEGLTSLSNDRKNVKAVINSKKSSIKTIRNKKLEKVLNNLIYPEETNKQSQYADLINFVADSYVDTILDRLAGVDLNNITAVARQRAADTEIKSTERISFTLNSLINEISADLEILLKNPTSAADEKIKEIEIDLQRINNEVKIIENYYKGTRKFLTYKDDNFKILRSYLAVLESYAELLRVLPSNQQLGDAFENALKEAVENETRKGINSLFEQANMSISKVQRTGDIEVPRTANTGGVDLTITVDYSNLTEIDKKIELPKALQKQGKGYTISYIPTKEKQSKMDVEISFNTGFTKKLSLKNWASIYSSNNREGFGETNILGALIRSAGLNSSQKYSLALLSNSSGILNSAHNFAKLSIAADILMGISQKDNWASDLVINDRSEKCIYVYSIPSLLNNIEKNLNITGYNGNYLGSVSHNILKNVKVKESRTNKYIQNMFGLLKSKMVSVKLSGGALPKKN